MLSMWFVEELCVLHVFQKSCCLVCPGLVNDTSLSHPINDSILVILQKARSDNSDISWK